MHVLLFLLYSLLCCYGIWKIPFFRKSGIRPAWLVALFALHVLTGCLHNIIAWRYYPGHGDIWALFHQSFQTRHRLISQIDLFISDNNEWTYFTHNAILFVHVILNIFSFDDLYIDTLLFAFPVFLGNTALYRVFRRRFPDDPLTAITIFILPSTLFWTSCVHREGILYMLLGFFLYALDRLSTFPRPARARPLISAACCFLLITYLRAAVTFTLIPALFAWALIDYPPFRRHRLLVIAASGLILLAVITGLHTPALSALAAQQQSFQVLDGHSRLPLLVMDGSISSFFRVLPRAIVNGLFEPLPGAGGQAIYFVFFLELLGIWAIVFLAALTLLQRHPSVPPAFSGFCLLFALAGLLLVGAIVPFVGAIVRYRSIYLPFLLAPCLHTIRSPLLHTVRSLLPRIKL